MVNTRRSPGRLMVALAIMACGAGCADSGEEESGAEGISVGESAVIGIPFFTCQGCSGNQVPVVLNAFVEANKRVMNATEWIYAAIDGQKPDMTRYTRWFGPMDRVRFGRVYNNFENLKKAFKGTGTTRATQPHWNASTSCGLPATAYVAAAAPWVIHLCPGYFDVLPTFDPSGGLSQPGSLIHEMSHFNVVAGTLDVTGPEYSQAARLASEDPDFAVINAANYAHFASNQDNLP